MPKKTQGLLILLMSLILPAMIPHAAASQELGVVQVQALRPETATTASLSPLPLFELPLSATVLASENFADRLPRDIADLTDYSPGVSRRASYWGVNTPTFSLRGFNAGESSAYYKDGFRYQGRGAFSMANVEAVEILRGPQSALYGWTDPGGAVQLRVKEPSAQTIQSATLQTDSWGKTASSLDLGGPAGESSRFRFIAAREQGGSFRDRQSGEQTLLAPSFAWDFSSGRQLLLSLEWLDDRRTTDYGIPAIDGAPAKVPPSRIYTEDWGRQHAQSARFTTRWQQPAWGGQLALAGSFYSFKYMEYRDAEPYAVTGTRIKRWYESYPEHYRWVTSYADWSREFETPGLMQRFAARLEMARESRSLSHGEWDEYAPIDVYNPAYGQISAPTADFSRYDQAWRNRSFGLVLQDELSRGNWTGLFGIRFSYLRQVFDYADYLPMPGEQHATQADHSITPRLGLSWRATPGVSLYANYSTGNNAALPQSRLFGGGAFAPQGSSQWEGGLKIQPEAGGWLASAALFEIERGKVLSRDPEHPGFSIQTGLQRSRGLELEWQGRLAPGWRLTAQTTWLDAFIAQDTRYAVGNRLPYAPRFGAAAWLTHRFAASPGGQWSLSGGLVHQGERYADFANSTHLPGYTRLDLGATYREKNWSATLALENAADRRYYASGVENRPAVIYPGAPRTLSLRLTQDFR